MKPCPHSQEVSMLTNLSQGTLWQIIYVTVRKMPDVLKGRPRLIESIAWSIYNVKLVVGSLNLQHEIKGIKGVVAFYYECWQAKAPENLITSATYFGLSLSMQNHPDALWHLWVLLLALQVYTILDKRQNDFTHATNSISLHHICMHYLQGCSICCPSCPFTMPLISDLVEQPAKPSGCLLVFLILVKM